MAEFLILIYMMHAELILLITMIAAISAGCLTPKHWLPTLPNDKMLHFLAFGSLGLLAGRIAQSKIELAEWLIGLLLVGCLIEALQHWIPGRTFCWRDIAANTAGIATASLGARVVIGI